MCLINVDTDILISKYSEAVPKKFNGRNPAKEMSASLVTELLKYKFISTSL
jgi:hypothetical protein